MSQAKKPVPTRPSQCASPSRPQTRASAPKQVTFNPEPVTIPSTLPAASTAPPTDTSSVHPPEVKGTIPVTDAANPSKIKNVLVSVASPISPADQATTDHNSTAKSDKPLEPIANESIPKQNGKPFPTANGSSDDTTSNEDEEEVLKEAVDQVATPATAAAVNNNNAALPESPSNLKRARGRPRKNMPQLLSTPVSPPKAAAASTGQTTPMSIDKIRRRGRGCGNCPGCLRDDCGKCSYCLDKPKFGGPGKKKQRCALRICSNFVSASPFRLPMMASGDLHLPISFTAQKSAPGVKNAVHTPEAAAVIAPSVSSLESIINTPIIIQKQESASLLASSENNVVAVAKEEVSNTKAQEDQPSQPEPKPDASPLPSKQPEVVSSASSSSSPSQSVSKAKQGPRSILGANMEMMKCCMCGRDRKVTIARSSKFCTQRCLNKWKELNPRKDPETAEPHDNPTTLLQVMPPSESDKSAPRAIRNLSINMAFPGTVLQRAPSPDLPSPTSAQPTQASVSNGVKRPATQEEPAVPAKKPALAANVPTGSSSITAGKAPKKKSQFDLPLNIDKWTVRDVSRYFEATPECCQYAPIFSEQEVDGTALLLLTHDSLVKCLGIKLGPALKVMTHVDRLKAQKQALS